MKTTKITVVGDAVKSRFSTNSLTDLVWDRCVVDDADHSSDIKITVRKWHVGVDGLGNPTLPISVYIDGSVPLYPTYVYNESGDLLAVDFGKVHR